jgi:hypothetical protein
MNQPQARLRRGPRRRRLLVAPAVIALSLAMAACGGGPSKAGVASLATTTTVVPTTAAGSGGPSPNGASARELVEYARCMRSHGVPNFPDPKIQTGPYGGIAFSVDFGGTGINPNSPAFQAAQTDCGPLIGAPKPAPGG